MRTNVFVLASVVAFAATPTFAQDKDQPKFELKFKPAKMEMGDSEIAKLQKERFNTSVEMVELHLMRVETGRDSVSSIGLAIDRVVQHGLELDSEVQDRLDLLKEAVRFAKHVEEIVNLQYNGGLVSKTDRVQSRYLRLNLEIALQRERERVKNP